MVRAATHKVISAQVLRMWLSLLSLWVSLWVSLLSLWVSLWLYLLSLWLSLLSGQKGDYPCLCTSGGLGPKITYTVTLRWELNSVIKGQGKCSVFSPQCG